MTIPAETPPSLKPAAVDRQKIIAIVGPSASGKTELICRLLSWFASQGWRVAVLKHTHKVVPWGDEGKDTGRYRQAGARVVALASPGGVQITKETRGDPPLPEILAALAPDSDLILVEGYKKGPLPKIALVPPPGESLPNYPHLVALVSTTPLTSELPVFTRNQVAELGTFIKEYLGLT